MALYFFTLLLTLLVNATLYYRKHISIRGKENASKPEQEPESIELMDRGYESDDESKWSTATVDDWTIVSRQYLTVYGLVVGADWLQGSFIYSLYKHEYELPEQTVAWLFATGFAFAAASALVVGYLADRFGRKKACLAYCASYTLSCGLTMWPSVLPLFAGRALGGVSATLLYSVFESWLVSQSRAQDDGDSLVEGTISTAASLNAAVAIVSGTMSEVLVSWMGSKRAPFFGSVACLVCAAGIIQIHWVRSPSGASARSCKPTVLNILQKWSANSEKDENYGSESGSWRSSKRMGTPSLREMRPGARTIIITGTTCAMEGSMYAMVFFWTRSIQNVRPALSGEAPYGIIFANFMAAMMLGSWFFWHCTQTDSSQQWVARLVQIGLPASATSLMVTVLSVHEHTRFFAFCIFEMALGVYFPAMGLLKSRIVQDSSRGWIYALMRMPLNVFVMAVLCSTEEDDSYRQQRFIACGALLLCSTVLLQRLVRSE